MKKIILLAGLFLCNLINAQTQISVTGNGETITEGQEFVFNELGESQILNIVVTNESAETKYFRLRMESITNADGSEVQFCFGVQCHYNVTEGGSVPNGAGIYQELGPGESSNSDGHFVNNNSGTNTSEPVVYVISVIEVDDTGTIIGDPLITFSYKYSALAGVNDFASLQNMGIVLNNTVVKDQLNLTASTTATMKLYGINGQLVKTAEIKNGSQSVDFSGLNAAIYIARFTTEDNRTSQIRIVKN